MIKRGIRPDQRVMAQLTSGWESRGRVGGVIRARVVLLVARVTQRAVQVVVVVDVAVGALTWRHRVRTRKWKAGAVVIEGCVEPRRSVVALVAALGKIRCHVIGIRGPLVILQMARDTCIAGQVVVIVCVAVRTLARWNRVHAGQRKAGTVVVEGRIQPRRCVVALITALGKVRGYVIGIRCSLIVLQVARHASPAVQVVVVVHVAVRTLPRRNRVHSSQGEGGQRVIERGVRPRIDVVA